MGVQVLVGDPVELEKYGREADMTKERIEKLQSGVFAKKISRHVAKATGATAASTFVDMEGEETFDPSLLGFAYEVVEERISDDDVIMIKGTKNNSGCIVDPRGANDYMLDEMERALHDALCIVKRTLESNVYLATTLGSREQLGNSGVCQALLIIPKVLSRNAAKDATELVAKLRAYHHTAQTKADKHHLSSMGLDLTKGTTRNNLEVSVIELITILRIDDMIKLVKDDRARSKVVITDENPKLGLFLH
ncbi:hypothetical protein MKW92_014405 [Papaver armeniacum]|nr:hypothetical protein MKW92_014405 [Papaver armeniacum]